MTLTTICWTRSLPNVQTARFVRATRSEPACDWYPEMGIWRVLYRCYRTIGHLTVGDFAVMYIPLFLLAFLVSS